MDNTVTQEHVEKIFNNSTVETITVGVKTTVVNCELPNGFVIIESSSCVDPDNYDETMGFNICKKRILDKIWELEGYVLQSKFDKS